MHYFAQAMFNIRREQGRLAEIEDAVRNFVELYPAIPSWRAGLAFLLAELGRLDEAREVFDGVGDLPRDANWLIGVTVLAEVCGALHDASRARGAVRAARALRGAQRGRGARGDLQRLRLPAARDPRRRARAVGPGGAPLRRRAGDAPAHGTRPWQARHARGAWGEMLLARGRAGGRGPRPRAAGRGRRAGRGGRHGRARRAAPAPRGPEGGESSEPGPTVIGPMPRATTVFICSSCGGDTPRWMGQCPSCGEWNTLVEEVRAPAAAARGGNAPARRAGGQARAAVGGQGGPPRPAQDHGSASWTASSAAGSCPARWCCSAARRASASRRSRRWRSATCRAPAAATLYVSGEESAAQVRLRAERLGPAPRWTSRCSPRPTWRRSLATLDAERPEVVRDRLDPDAPRLRPRRRAGLGRPGPRGRPTAITRLAKARGIAVLLVGHVTKEGALAGPRVLEHLVDCVLLFEGERERTYRTLRALKNRFGSTNEVGVFEMRQGGLVEVADPSARFVGEATARREASCWRRWRAPGRCWSRSRRSCRPRSSCRRGGSPTASTATGWRSCSPCSAATRASASAARRLRQRRRRRPRGRAGGRSRGRARGGERPRGVPLAEGDALWPASARSG